MNENPPGPRTELPRGLLGDLLGSKIKLLCCPKCRGSSITPENEQFLCNACSYSYRKGWLMP